MSFITRGGLLKLSNVVYVACLHAFLLYKAIQKESDTFKFLMSPNNPWSVFSEYFLQFVHDNSELEAMLTTACKAEHSFSKYMKKMTAMFFNIMAKNYVSELNDTIHKAKKRNTLVKEKLSATAKKVRKLSLS